MLEMEKLCIEHPAVKAEIEKLKLPHGVTVCTDPWIYGTDDENETRRLWQFYMYIIDCDHPQSNHYSLPCAFSPVFDGMTRQLVRIDYLPTGTDHSTRPTQPWKPVKAVHYAHDLLDEPLRTDLKPYIVQQPEGPSFSVDGNAVTWQKWRFRIGFNYRDGLVLHGVTYDRRNVFYRLSLCEMTVPYGGMYSHGFSCSEFKLMCFRPSCSLSSKTSFRCRRCWLWKYRQPAVPWLRLPWSHQVFRWVQDRFQR